jgi:murein DD-endopeptidase MepM/ murein hydrolase activator NlpD
LRWSNPVRGRFWFTRLAVILAVPLLGWVEPTTAACRPAAVSQFQRYQLRAGDTVANVAKQYNLAPETLLGVNPSLRGGLVPVGRQILIPPFDGVLVRVNPGVTLASLARTYGIRADVLFEVNGCQTSPSLAFIPGVRWSPQGTQRLIPNSAPPSVSGRYRYPLANPGQILTRFAQDTHPGVDIAAPVQTPVVAVAAGTVAFVGDGPEGTTQVVINHAAGVQTRYAQLAQIAVKVGQTVSSGTPLATVASDPNNRPSHLHFEVRLNSPQGWVAQDPGLYIQGL